MSRKNSTIDPPIADRFNPPCEGKYIAYDRTTGDYALFLDRQYLGHAATYQVAETRLNDALYEQFQHTQIETADLEADACHGADVVTTFTHTSDGACFTVTTVAPVTV